ncbi:M91 family zinc metallopeptidase [Pseudomonas saxonica]|uniref:M91 family zinc metallopeptidase n=1 Tax=Pseudomonas saxonica TaxID=2600598 RepID=UPI003989BC04
MLIPARGADFIRAGTGRAFIDAGEGNDVAVGGQGHTVLWGNEGEDLLTAGSGSNVIYAGKGQDILDGVKGSDKIYTGSDPAFITDGKIDLGETMSPPSSRPNPNIIKVSSTPLSESGFIVLGSESFIERVQDDLRLLLSSDAGHRLISELTKSIRKSNKPITIAELKHVKNGLYIPNIGDGRSFIQVGKSGIPDFGGTVYYNPTFSSKDSLPIAVLYHELCHAYNHVTGTRFLGASPDGPAGVKQAPLINNVELQAVGLPCNVEPFDFDGDPTTPASKTNPKPYSENGIREELGLPLRTTYIYYSDV